LDGLVDRGVDGPAARAVRKLRVSTRDNLVRKKEYFLQRTPSLNSASTTPEIVRRYLALLVANIPGKRSE